MSIYAIATIVNESATVDTNNYIISWHLSATDGSSVFSSGTSNSYVALGTDAKKADESIRRDMASKVATNGWTIDPDDIYIPFSG
jgi:hypothetical protein